MESPAGEEEEDWSERGDSMKVATRPEAMCHSMWQWKSQTRGEEELVCVFFWGEGGLIRIIGTEA